MKFQGKISYRPARTTDPIPFVAWLYVDGKQTTCRWCATHEDALEALAEMRSLYLNRSFEVTIDLPDGDVA